MLRNLPTLETDRLILRKMTLNDAEAVFAYASDPEVTRYVSWETHRKIGDSESFLRSVLEGYEKGEAAEWGLVYKGDGRFVGGCGVVRWELDHSRAELGYVLSREYWGRGLMPEAVRAMLSFGFGRIVGLNRVEARCIAENSASARVHEYKTARAPVPRPADRRRARGALRAGDRAVIFREVNSEHHTWRKASLANG